MRGSALARVPVHELVADRWHFEARSPELDDASHVAVLAQWSRSTVMSRSMCALVAELQAYGYRVVVSSACEATGHLEWADPVDLDQLTVIRKPNVGYDFGSWSLALHAVPDLSARSRVILANDSMAGPFIPMAPLLEHLDSTPADVWALTDSYQFGYHLQSYFLGFTDGVLCERPLQHFWAGICHEPDRDTVIGRYELGLSRLLREEGFVQVPAFAHELVVQAGENPVIKGWRELLRRGFPFIKREILRDPSVAPGGAGVRAVAKRMLHVDVDEWVEDRPA